MTDLNVDLQKCFVLYCARTILRVPVYHGMKAVLELVQEVLSASATALGTAFLGGILGALLLHRAGLLERALSRWSVRGTAGD